MSHEGTVDGDVRRLGPLKLSRDTIANSAVKSSTTEVALGPFAVGYSRTAYPGSDATKPDWDAWFRIGKLHFELGWWIH